MHYFFQFISINIIYMFRAGLLLIRYCIYSAFLWLAKSARNM
jgi:hypothetical protein